MIKRIITVAHNSMKPKLLEFLKEREDWFWGRSLTATGLTADFMKREGLRIPVEGVSPGREHGFRDLKELIEQDEIGMVIFFRDPNIVQEYEVEIRDFLQICNLKNIPLATNPRSAELLILGLIKFEASERNKQPDI